MSTFEEKFKQFIDEEKENVSKPQKSMETEESSWFDDEAAAFKLDDSINDTISSVFGVDIPEGCSDLQVQVFKPEDWHEDVRMFIPKVNEHYVWNTPANVKDLLTFQVAVIMKDNTFMYGEKAAGKSSFIEQYCALTNRPFIRQNGSGDIETSSVFGSYTVDPKKGTIWNDGLCTMAVKHGAVYLQDEGTGIPPEIILGYQWLLESGGKLMLSDKQGSPEEKLVEPDDRFLFCVADNTNGSGDMNGNYAGTNVWNSATLDRFGTFIYRKHMAPEDEVKVLRSIVPSLTEGLAGRMVQFANMIRTSHNQGEIGTTMSLRGLESWGKKAVMFRDPAKSLHIAFFNRLAADDEREAVSGMYSTIFDDNLV